jgi:hypothetical protein
MDYLKLGRTGLDMSRLCSNVDSDRRVVERVAEVEARRSVSRATRTPWPRCR